ncbi:adenylosuccinate lyase [Fusarium heterosporum]|uniref:Adenylosuccinate lyase n=1 Tax=Fusarium heterosporum TaxID=42747 RepID=A0A8H5T416_FUSHE|nr:adenylosuccinate lyase [Fusarium heterosporum]
MFPNNTHEPPHPGGSSLAEVFGQRSQYSTWRELWYYLAHSQRELGLGSISSEAIAEMKSKLAVTDKALKETRDTRGDEGKKILKHIYEFAQDAPAAQGWINWDAPLTYVAENTHVILVSRALDLLIVKVLGIVMKIRVFALEQHCEQCVFQSGDQPEQMSTLGRIATGWALDLMKNLAQLKSICDGLLLCGTRSKIVKPSEHFDNIQVSWEVGNAVVELARTFSRLVSEIYQLHAKDPPIMAGNVKPIGLAFADANVSFLVEWWAKMPADRLTLGQTFLMPSLFERIEIVLMWFADAVDDLHTFPLRIPASVGLQSVVTRKILDHMVEKGQSRELVIQSLRDVSFQTLKRMHDLRLPNDFYGGIKMTPFFEPVWKEIDDWYRFEKNTKRHEQATISICGPRGTLDREMAIHQESIKRVAFWQIAKKQAVLAESKKSERLEAIIEKWEHPSWKSSNWRRDCRN